MVTGKLDGPAGMDIILETVRTYRRKEEVVYIMIDVVGESGAAVYDALVRSSDARNMKVIVVPVDVREKAVESDKFWNRRTEVIFGLRDWLHHGGAIPDDDYLLTELVAATYEFDNTGRLKVKPKEKEKDILKRSPNVRDALALAVYRYKANPMEIQTSSPRETVTSLARFARGY